MPIDGTWAGRRSSASASLRNFPFSGDRLR